MSNYTSARAIEAGSPPVCQNVDSSSSFLFLGSGQSFRANLRSGPAVSEDCVGMATKPHWKTSQYRWFRLNVFSQTPQKITKEPVESLRVAETQPSCFHAVHSSTEMSLPTTGDPALIGSDEPSHKCLVKFMFALRSIQFSYILFIHHQITTAVSSRQFIL